jgi:hypothetical protein
LATVAAIFISCSLTINIAEADKCISGYKYDSCTGQPLPGWQIQVIDVATNNVKGTATTNSWGSWQVCGLPPGNYRVAEIAKPGWQSTNPTQNVVLGTVNITGINFYNTHLGCIKGYKYDGCTGLPLPGWQIQVIDVATNNVKATATTDSWGIWQVCGLTPGNYRVTEIVKPGWQSTNPTQNVVLGCSNSTGVNFWNTPLRCIRGCNYNTCTGLPISGWQIQVIDAATNNVKGTATTDATGIWQVCGLPPGNYRVTEIVKPGWQSTNPTQNVVLGCANLTGVDFWNTPTSCIIGWSTLGGYVISGLGVVGDNQGRTETWVRGGDNALWVSIDDSWHGKGGVLTSDPVVIKDFNDKIHVLVRGSDYSLWDFIYDPITENGHWKGLGGYITEKPATSPDPMNSAIIRIAVKGGDNALWTCDFDVYTETYVWTSQGGSLTSPPYILFDGSSNEHIFVRGNDNQLWDRKGSWTVSGWSRTWNPLGGYLANGPIATIEPGYPNYVAVFAKGGDNALWMCDVNSANNPETGTWHGFGGTITSDPFVVADASGGKIHVFVRGGDSALWENIFSTNPWNPGGNQWQKIGGTLLAYAPGAAIGSYTQSFVVGTDHTLWRNVHTTL